MEGHFLPAAHPGILDHNSNNVHPLNSASRERENDKENSEDVISVSSEDCKGRADVIGVHVNVPLDRSVPGDMTSEKELRKNDGKYQSELEVPKSDAEIMQVDNTSLGNGADKALVEINTQANPYSPVECSNSSLNKPANADSLNVKGCSGSGDILLDNNFDSSKLFTLNVEDKSVSITEVSISDDNESCRTETLCTNKTNSLSLSNNDDKSKTDASGDDRINGNDKDLLVGSSNVTIRASSDCSNSENKASVKDKANDRKEDEDDFEDALEFVTDHFAENSDDESKEAQEEVVLITELSDVGRYSYACLVAHSLHTLFGYTPLDRKFQENCIKKLLRRLRQSKKMQQTMMMVVRGDISLGDSDPLVDSLKKQFPNPRTGACLIIEDLLEMALKEGIYDARMRTLLKFISLVLGVLPEEIEDLEDKVQAKFREDEHEPTEEENEEKLSKVKSRKIKRIALISVAAIGGGALIGLTAGIAAPLIAVGAGAIIGGVGAAGLGTVAGAAIIGSIFGVAGAGLTGFKMKKRIGELEEFEFEPLTEGRSLHVTVAVSGWLNEKYTDFRTVWLGLANSQEQYILRYESKYLRELGQAMDYIANIAITAAVKHTLKQTLLSGLLAAISWPLTLLSVASIIDNPWSICTQRSTNAGRQLAEVLLSRQQGRRPVTLIGFSFGARVIFSCLEEMASRKNSEGIVEDVILLGAPVSGCVEDWSRLERVVAGRIVNGYARGDWLLKFMYRTASVQMTIAGLDAVKWENRRMHNIDLTDIVSGHLDYFNQIDRILNAIGIKTVEHAVAGSAESLKQWTSLRRPDCQTSEKLSVTSENTERLSDVMEEISAEERLLVVGEVMAPGTATSDTAEGSEVALPVKETN